MHFLKGGCQKSDIPVIDDFRFGKTVNEPKTLGTTGLVPGTVQSNEILFTKALMGFPSQTESC